MTRMRTVLDLFPDNAKDHDSINLRAIAGMYDARLRAFWRDCRRADYMMAVAMAVGGQFARGVYAAWKQTAEEIGATRFDAKEAAYLTAQVELVVIATVPGMTLPGDERAHHQRRRDGLCRAGQRLLALAPLPPRLPFVAPSAAMTSWDLLGPERLRQERAQREEAAALRRDRLVDLDHWRKHIAPRRRASTR